MKILRVSIALLAVIATQASAEPTPEEWMERFRPIETAICEKVKSECLVNYSVYEEDENGLPVNNLGNTAIEGKVVVVAARNFLWGNGEGYKSQVVENPSWRDLAVIANEVILVTGDLHHVYLEGFEVMQIAGGIIFIELVFGS